MSSGALLSMALPVIKGGAGVVLQKDDGTVVSLSFRLDFPCSNNVAEYESPRQWPRLCFANGNSETSSARGFQARIQQVNGEFSLKEGALASYRTAVQKLVKLFSNIQFEHVS